MSGLPQAITLGATVGFGLVFLKKLNNGRDLINIYWEQLTNWKLPTGLPTQYQTENKIPVNNI